MRQRPRSGRRQRARRRAYLHRHFVGGRPGAEPVAADDGHVIRAVRRGHEQGGRVAHHDRRQISAPRRRAGVHRVARRRASRRIRRPRQGHGVAVDRRGQRRRARRVARQRRVVLEKAARPGIGQEAVVVGDDVSPLRGARGRRAGLHVGTPARRTGARRRTPHSSAPRRRSVRPAPAPIRECSPSQPAAPRTTRRPRTPARRRWPGR